MGKKKKDPAKGQRHAPSRPAAVDPRPTSRRKYWVTRALLVVVLASGAVVFYARSGSFYRPRVASGSLKGDNVLLITLDTTRADHLPVYGYKGVKTPGLDRLAGKSFIFEDAIAQVPLTLPSHTTILTGQLPIGHGVRDNEGYLVDPKTPTLATVLKRDGYATAAFVSAFVLDSRWGLDRGFDSYFDDFNEFREVNRDEIQRKAEETEAQVERWLPANRDKRFFCWVHFYDPHEPYDPPEPYASSYAANRYDGEIAYMDQYVGKLLGKLEELGLTERTIVVVTGDHGEGLGEHDESTHAMFIYDSTLHVPLLIKLPGSRQKRFPGIVRHIDLAPTVLDLLGIPKPDEMQGESLIPKINGTERTQRLAYSESQYAQLHYGWSPLRSLTTDKYQFIDSPKPELFDRQKDPRQIKNLIRDREAVAESLGEQLRGLAARFTGTHLEGPKKMDAETEEKLRSLGYLGSPVASTPESLKIDPKDKSRIVRDVNDAVKALSRREFQGALRLALPIAQSEPGILDAHLVAGSSYMNLQQYDKALDELFKVIALKPDHIMALATLGTTYDEMGNPKEAERWYLKVFQYDKEHSYTVVKLANLYRRMKDSQRADAYLARAIKPVDDSLASISEPAPRARLYAARAEMLFGADRLSEAEEDLEAAIALTPRAPDLHFNLAQVYEKAQNVPSAIDNYRKETEVAPSNFGAYLNLGLLQFQAGRFSDASVCFQKLLQLRPGEPRASFLLAETLGQLNTNLEQAVQLTRQGLAQMPDYKRGYELLADLYTRLGRSAEAAQAAAAARGR